MFADPYAWKVLQDRNPSTVLPFELRDLVFIEPYILRQHILDLGTTGPREVNEDVALVQDPLRARSAGRQMVSHQAGDLEVPPDLKHLVQ